MDLIAMAAWKDHSTVFDGSRIDVERGQVPTSERRLSDRWGWSRGKVRRFLALMERESRLVSKPALGTAHGGTILTVCNYDTYQSGEDSDRPTDETTDGPRTDHTERREIRETPPGERIEELLGRYRDDQRAVVEAAISDVHSTRRRGFASDSIIVALLAQLERYPPDQVVEGCRTYVAKAYATSGKAEKYLLGIVRNSTADATAPGPGIFDRPEERVL